MKRKYTLQLFAEGGDPKTFTQEELNKIVEERIAREKNSFTKQLEEKELEYKTQLANSITEETEKAKALMQLEIDKFASQNANLSKELQQYKISSRKSEIISAYTKDELPCANEFANIVGLIANIEDESERTNVYGAIKKYVVAIQDEYKKEFLKGKEPDGGNGSNASGKNPFASENLTEILSMVRDNKDLAKEMATNSGKFEKYAYLFK